MPDLRSWLAASGGVVAVVRSAYRDACNAAGADAYARYVLAQTTADRVAALRQARDAYTRVDNAVQRYNT